MITEKNPADGTFHFSGYVVDAVQYLALVYILVYIFNLTFTRLTLNLLLKLDRREYTG